MALVEIGCRILAWVVARLLRFKTYRNRRINFGIHFWDVNQAGLSIDKPGFSRKYAGNAGGNDYQ